MITSHENNSYLPYTEEDEARRKMANLMLFNFNATLLRSPIVLSIEDIEEAVERYKRLAHVTMIQVYIWHAKVLSDFTIGDEGPFREYVHVYRDRALSYIRQGLRSVQTDKYHWERVDSWELEAMCPGRESDEDALERILKEHTDRYDARMVPEQIPQT